MEQWLTEYHENVGLSFKTTQTLYKANSPYQSIEVVDTVAYGRMLLLDGAVMITEKDEFVYHEMISHVAMLVHPQPKRILVIGGGDGGTIREILKHPEVESVVLCEIDGMVVDASREFFPNVTSGLNNPKVSLKIADGIVYMAEEARDFDIIIIDSTDPVGPGEGLFTEEFYRNLFKALKHDGIMVAQTESPFLDRAIIKKIYPIYKQIFPIVRMYTAHIPTYPSGFWSWAFCSRKYPTKFPSEHLDRVEKIAKSCQYYNSAIHEASFALPNFVESMLKETLSVR